MTPNDVGIIVISHETGVVVVATTVGIGGLHELLHDGGRRQGHTGIAPERTA